MNPKNRLLRLSGLTLVILFLLACSTLIPEPTPTPIPSTATPIPPTATSTLIPPTATSTPIPLGALLMGKWAADVGGGDELFFTFDDGEITITFEGENMVGRYTVDFSFDPAHLDLLFEDEEDIFTILEFIDENTIRIDGDDSPETRPTTFGEDTLIFKRVTESE